MRTQMECSPTGLAEDHFQLTSNLSGDGATAPLGAVLFCRGGLYAPDYHEGDPVARRFNELDSPLCCSTGCCLHLSTAQRDALRAISDDPGDAAEWRVNPNQLAVLGFSAGGHLAACAGLMYDRKDFAENDSLDAFSAKPDALVLCYSVLSVT